MPRLTQNFSFADKIFCFRKLPHGCGEQNMINFVPNIVVLDYLTAVNKLTPEFRKSATEFLETGYQKQLTYRHDDGSFSVWGKKDDSGSTWLTAYVAKSFRQAAKYIFIDVNIIENALNFLSHTQSEDGSFVEVGYILQKDIQGGSSNGIALTSYTLITFLENKDFVQTSYNSTINKALAFVRENYSNITDNYSLAIASYALQLATKNNSLSQLEMKAIKEAETMHWEREVFATHENSFSKASSSLDIEMTAYALQAFIEAGRLADSVPIMKWLVSQRNENGGFISTQDTVVGLQALAKVAANMYSANTNVNISIKFNHNESLIFNVNQSNALIVQKHELPSSARYFEITARGEGFSIFQISYQYNTDTRAEETYKFNIEPVVDATNLITEERRTKGKRNTFRLKICVNYIPDESTEKSNMAIMEVNFPSGYIFNTEFLKVLKSTTKNQVRCF